MIEATRFRDSFIYRATLRPRPIGELHHPLKMTDIYFILIVICIIPKNKFSIDDAEKYARRQTDLLR
uniref:Uncharacterized protein n=1 Tax=Ralstonia syzygii R24 TaxID=907261 RepID=G3A505_9RALS|nr:hypothetical protein RALSY_30784 [Ralstonia syzygii R24]